MQIIRGSLHVLDIGAGNFHVVFASEIGTGSHAVSGRSGVEHFISKTLRCDPQAVTAEITAQNYATYFA
jgi:hypothetical protein